MFIHPDLLLRYHTQRTRELQREAARKSLAHRNRRRLRPTALVIAAVLAMSSCLGGGDRGDRSLPAMTEDAVPTSYAELTTNSPIDSLLGLASSEDAAIEMERTVGRLTAECMRRAGFEYIPALVEPARRVGISDDGPALYSDEWVATYGFGVSTQRFRQSQVGPHLVGYADQLDEPAASRPDPNQDYLDGLSSDARLAYSTALYGEAMAYADGRQIAGSTGCLEQAATAVFDTATQARFYSEFGDVLENLRHRAEADPRLVEYRQAVADCVMAAGYAWSPDEDPQVRFGARLAEIEELSVDDLVVLAQVQAEEVAVAQVVVGCRGGYLNEQYLLGQIQHEYEQRFLDENRDRLDGYRHN